MVQPRDNCFRHTGNVCNWNSGKAHVIGILVHGDNHFIVRGPRPSRDVALALVRRWSLIRIGEKTPAALEQWRISTKEFREDLQWAILAPGETEKSPAVI